jgi:hypothetical protein
MPRKYDTPYSDPIEQAEANWRAWNALQKDFGDRPRTQADCEPGMLDAYKAICGDFEGHWPSVWKQWGECAQWHHEDMKRISERVEGTR